MPLQIQGSGGAVGQVDTNTNALRTGLRPTDVGSQGSYAVASTTGTVAAGQGANSAIYSFRWTDSTRYALIRRCTLSMASLGTGFTAGVGSFGIIFARSFTASDTGGTALTMTTNNAKRKTAFATSLVGDLRISSTAALSAGTRTLDAQDLALLMYAVSTSTNTVMLPTATIWGPDFAGEWPLVLAQNEGFIIRATVPATGTWQAQVCIEWTEITASGSGF